MSFELLGLKPELLRAVSEKGYTTPTPIQSQAIPAVLSGRDLIAGAQTGTGKTAAFVLPMLQRLTESQQSGRTPRALVLTPTRELAAQVAESARDYGKYVSLRTAVVFGGVSIGPQINALRAGFRALFGQHDGPFRERVDAVADEFTGSPEVLEIVDFIRAEPLRPLVLPERDTSGG